MDTKITDLTALSVRALLEAIEVPSDAVTVTLTTATFHMPPADAAAYMEALMATVADQHGRRGHPYASLHSVLRKVKAAAEPTEETTP